MQLQYILASNCLRRWEIQDEGSRVQNAAPGIGRVLGWVVERTDCGGARLRERCIRTQSLVDLIEGCVSCELYVAFNNGALPAGMPNQTLSQQQWRLSQLQ